MLTRDALFDPADYPDAEKQLGLLNDALISQDVAFVVAAPRTVLEARGRDPTAIGLDPRLSEVLAALDALGVDFAAAGRSGSGFSDT